MRNQMRNKWKKPAGLILTALVMSLLAACGGGQGKADAQTGSAQQGTDTANGSNEANGQEARDELFSIRIVQSASADPVYIADQEGIFAKNGLRVEYVGLLANSNAATAVATGAADFAWNPAGSITAAISNGYEIRAVAAGWGTSEEHPMVQVLVKADSEYQKLEDLNGKKVAIPFAGEPYWLEAKAQLDLAGIEEVIIGFDKMETSIASDAVDAVFVISPYPEKLLASGDYRSIWTALDVIGAEKGWPQQYTNLKFIEEHPDIVRAYVKSIAEACDFARENPEQASRDIAKALGVEGADPGIYIHEYPEHALVDEEDAQLWIDLEKKFGLLGSDVTTADVYTNEFNPYWKQ